MANKSATKNSDSLIGGSGNDTLDAKTFSNVTLGGAGGGNDLFIIPGNKSTTVIGSVGNDTLRVSASFDLRNSLVSGIENLVYMGTAASTLTGNGGAGSIIGGAGNDTLRDGGGGIVSNLGATTLVGGAGNDRYQVSNSKVVIVESSLVSATASLNGGTDTVVTSVDYDLANAANVENLVLTGEATLGYGNAGANSIVGNDRGNMLVGLQGSDTIVGGAGDDLIFGVQATEKPGKAVYFGVDLSSLLTPDMDGNWGFFGAMADGALVAQVDDADGTYFVKLSKTGVIDTSRGGDGSLSPFDVFGDSAVTGVDTSDASVVLLADGRFLVSGLQKDGKEAYARLTANGALDNTFGTGGYFIPENAIGNGEEFLAQFGNGVDGFLVAKITATGTRFQVFSKEGKSSGTSSEIKSTDYDFSILSTDPNVQMQSGKAVILGIKADQSAPVLVRLTSTGALDSSTANQNTPFGTSGILTLNSTYDYTNAIFDVRANAIYVSGAVALEPSEPASVIMRFTANGAVDTAFGAAGVLTLSDMKGGAARILSDGRILERSSGPEGSVFKIHAKDGKSFVETAVIDSDYDFSGAYDMDFEPLALVQGTKLVLEGRSVAGMFPVLVRLNATGTVDRSFGDNGYFTGGESKNGEIYDFDQLNISVLSDGKLLATGIKLMTADGESALVLRLTADGKFDASFGVNGILSSEPGEGGVGFRILSNGAIVLVGGSSDGSSATLYTKDGKVDSAFGSDPAGADSLVGGAGNDTIVEGAGTATLDGGSGNDTLSGKGGNDFYIVDSAMDVVLESNSSLGGNDTIASGVSYTLGGGVENLLLRGAAAIGVGSSINNAITGNSLANTLDGGSGNDTLIGGLGNDYYIVESALDVIVENVLPAGGIDTVESNSNHTLSGGLENLLLRGAAAIGVGSSINNAITGNSLANTLDGGLGNDTLIGGLGNDYYIVDTTSDVVFEVSSAGTDSVLANVSGSTLGANVEVLILGSVAISGAGNAAANTLVGNSLANTLNGEGGADSLVGGGGNDYYIIDSLSDSVVEGVSAGIDSVLANITGTTLSGNTEVLRLGNAIASGTGNSLDNFLIGNSLSNSLFGGIGNDSLQGASFGKIAQKDTLTGGNGNDAFILGGGVGCFYDDGDTLTSGTANFAYIVDFNVGQDKLVLSGAASNYTLVTGAAIGVTGLTGNGFYGLFREQGATDELVAVLKSATNLTRANTISNAQFIQPVQVV